VNADGTKYMITSLDQNAGQIQYVKTDDNPFESVAKFKYVRTT